MTGSDDSNSSTRPISVAELLARNGTIGAPPVGGRRRRRRGNTDAVTVAELTGEIPVIRADDPAPAEDLAAPAAEPETVPEPDADATASTNGVVEQAEEAEEAEEAEAEENDAEENDADQAADAVTVDDEADLADEAEAPDEADLADEPEGPEDTEDDGTDAVAEDSDAAGRTPRFRFGRFGRKDSAVDAEDWTPDPVDDADVPADTDGIAEREIEDLDDEAALDSDGDRDGDRDELPSYLRSTEEPLFGGQTVADDLARRGGRPAVDEIEDLDEQGGDEDEDEDFRAEDVGHDEPKRMSAFVHGAWIVGQSIVAVIFGAGLFVAFDQLWKWNNIVALVLSVLVILGLVVGVRVVRKTEDIGSTLIAVAVGALVTLGPLALLQSG